MAADDGVGSARFEYANEYCNALSVRIVLLLMTRFSLLLGYVVISCTMANALRAEQSTVERQAKALEKEVVAPCCWTNPISEHYSESAYQLRRKIRHLLGEGNSPAVVKQLLVDEYGERILARPRAIGFTLLVWVVPPLGLLVAVFLVGGYLRSRLERGESLPRAPEDKERQVVEAELKKFDRIA